MNRLTDHLLTRLQARCEHESRIVTADILDGDFFGGPGGEQGVQWCPRCGAYRRTFDVYGRRPRYSAWRSPSPATARDRERTP